VELMGERAWSLVACRSVRKGAVTYKEECCGPGSREGRLLLLVSLCVSGKGDDELALHG